MIFVDAFIPAIKKSVRTICILLGFVFLHWIIANLYVNVCAPTSFVGIFTSALTMGSPICTVLNKLQYSIIENYGLIWVAIGTSIISYFVKQY